MKRMIVVLLTLGMLLALPQVAGARPGILDRSFGENGIAVVPSIAPDARAFDVAVGIDSNIVAVGDIGFPPLVAGLTEEGLPDTGFGDSGLVPDVPWRCDRCQEPVFRVIKQGTGFLVAGVHRGGGVVARLEADGTFGRYVSGFGPVWDMARTPGGKTLIVAGDSVWRLEPTGEVDKSFGDSGWVAIDEGPGRKSLSPNEIDVTRNGSILVTGSAYPRGRTQRVFVAKLEKNGEFDKSFGRNGSGVVRPLRGYGTDIAVNSTSVFVAATLLPPRGKPSRHHAALVKLSLDGKLYRNFGKRGVVRSSSGRTFSSSLLLTRGHLIVDNGVLPTRQGRFPSLRVSKLNWNGKLDRRFGRRGRVRIQGIQGQGMAFDDAGRILIAGSQGEASRRRAVVIRLKGY